MQSLPLDTRDGVVIRCSYYPGGFIENLKTKEVTPVPGTEVIPILMLHGWDGQRTDYDYTASFLQRLGHAVLVPDLRGHGESLVRRQGAREIQIDRGALNTAEIRSMVLDIEACKKISAGQKQRQGTEHRIAVRRGRGVRGHTGCELGGDGLELAPTARLQAGTRRQIAGAPVTGPSLQRSQLERRAEISHRPQRISTS